MENITSNVSQKELVDKIRETITEVNNKPTIATTTTAGKALVSTSTAGEYAWGDAGKIDYVKTGGSDLTVTEKRVEIDKILTKAQYDALEESEKNNGMNYYVTDEGGESSSVAWGSITGTLSSQTDLNSALAGKADTNGTYSSMTVGNATKATQDADGNVITSTYATTTSSNFNGYEKAAIVSTSGSQTISLTNGPVQYLSSLGTDSLTLTLPTPSSDNVGYTLILLISVGSTAPTITWAPASNVYLAGGSAPELEEGINVVTCVSSLTGSDTYGWFICGSGAYSVAS